VPTESSSQLWQAHLKTHKASCLDDLIELLRIPSVSTSAEHVEDVKRAAEWVAARLKKAQFENIEILPTGEHACVYADWLHAPGQPTVLVYGHFDVQPEDPLELWDNPPFEPVIKDGRIYARGATDMKGNLIIAIAGIEALLATEGKLPVNVKFLFEGQEEIGSKDLGTFVAANRDRLACDLILCADGLQWAAVQPMICLGVKGACGLQIDLETADMDLHSGLYGGAVPNAIHALTQLLGTLRDQEGHLLVDGFLDPVVELSPLEKELINKVPFDADSYQTPLGVDALVGEPGYTTYERLGVRPTIELNGIWGGYQGQGVKTIVPAKAHAKISCRLVPNQEPTQILEVLEAHLHKNCPPGARLTLTREAIRAKPYVVPAEHPGVQAAAEILTEAYGRAPYFIRVGGSLPIMGMFLEELKAHTVMVGFGLSDEGAHSPNEFLRLSNFDFAPAIYSRLLQTLATIAPSDLAGH
jgi:acetylornithine deacetylase/succinyl-diaminopimelate desuccinylase-like protein